MNIIKIILLIGLGYIALTEKKEKMRNILLLILGLLAFCMFSLEGFTTINFGDKDLEVKDGKITIPDNNNKLSSNGIEYTFPSGDYDINNGTVPDYECPTGKIKGDVSRASVTGTLTSSNIDEVFPCVSPQKCSDASGFKCDCGYNKVYKETDICDGSKCTSDDFIKGGACCDDKPDFCKCLKIKDGENRYCNSGWVLEGKYIKKNAEGDGWSFSNKYWDDDNYKCWPMALEDLWSGLGIFSGKCAVPLDITQEDLDKCDPPLINKDTDKNTTPEPANGGHSTNDTP